MAASDWNITLLDCLLAEHYENEKELSSLCASVVNYSVNSNSLHNIATQVITSTLQKEVRETLFRSQSVATALLTEILQFYGTQQVRACVKNLVKSLKKHSWDINFQGMQEDTDPENLFKAIEKVAKMTSKLFKSINQIKWSSEVLRILSILYSLVEEKFPGMGKSAVNSILFLRFVFSFLVNPVHHNILNNNQTDKECIPQFILLGKILNLVYNDMEIIETGTCLSCLNVVIKKYSSDWKKQSFPFASFSYSPDKVKKFSDPKLNSGQQALAVIENTFQTYEIQIWQRLNRNPQHSPLASQFKSKCSEANQKLMGEIEKENLSISLSYNSLQIIQKVTEYFDLIVTGSEHEKKLAQMATIIRELSLKHDLLDTVEYVVNSVFPGNIELCSMSASESSNDNENFYDFFNKFHILMRTFAKSKDSNESLNTFIRKMNEKFAIEERALPNDSKLSPEQVLLHEQLKFVLKRWDVHENVIDLLVPGMVADFEALKHFDFAQLKSYYCSTLGNRKQWQRAKQAFFRFNTLSESVQNLKFDISTLNTEELCTWLRLMNLDNYVPSFEAQKITGQLLLNCSSDSLKSFGVTTIGHRKLLLRVMQM